MAATGVTAKIGIVYLSVWVWEYCRRTMCNNKKTNKTINAEFHPGEYGCFLKGCEKKFLSWMRWQTTRLKKIVKSWVGKS